MNHSYSFLSIVIVAFFVVTASGCSEPQTPSDSTTGKTTSQNNEYQFNSIEQSVRRSQNGEVLEPVIDLVTPPGWSKSELRALPTDDHGFTVAFEHESGLCVTLYQYTRGQSSIPDDVDSASVREELQLAKNGIEQAVEFGFWQAAKENASGTIMLGDSQQKALWSQYNLTVDGTTVASDIYVWTCSNAFLKLRCSSRSEDVTSNQTVLKPLLTSLGSSVTLKE